MPITDFYGYIIDMAFRTNAAESKLLLQVDPEDRIYDDNNNEDTMGQGSNMIFKSDSLEFDDASIKNLMKSIKIVFFRTGTREIVATAYLDVDNAESTEDGVCASLHIVDAEKETKIKVTTGTGDNAVTKYYYGTQTTAADGKVTTEYTTAAGVNLFRTVYTPAVTGETPAPEKTEYFAWVPEVPAGEGTEAIAAHWSETAATETEIAELENSKVEYESSNTEAIMDMPQNTATALSVLVYLDGNTVTNKDVAYTAQKSMTGKLNLQFASSANLVAMEYKDLHQASPADATTATTAPANP
jgi:hypothetical protein